MPSIYRTVDLMPVNKYRYKDLIVGKIRLARASPHVSESAAIPLLKKQEITLVPGTLLEFIYKRIGPLQLSINGIE